ncbi:probable ATP-dependent RNA helicase DDX56 [Centruroides sculpturatus]|uniref:probable ATP-dependent RNA helicase DDX56 n=1 Tax=Centruroides sculpturatus TaxID=218467 RepID=UPI000C6EE2F2|nr:probable ATP-dependent RNA helicase DDX56 [Centruroides sculpturatus]XP_023230575.1 probable ATP-dependent RNA helicase DDX56 [Centruroides sculpturatus]
MTDKIGFHEMNLDDRILQAIATLGWHEPTLIQEKAIPLALEGKDILARARTGSGKTAAFVIPVIQKILMKKQVCKEQIVRTLILVPTKELSKQMCRNVQELCKFCSRDVRCVDISGQVDINAQKPILMEKPDIIVGTPSRVLAHLQAKNLILKDSLETLIIDEADLVFSFGYEKDVEEIKKFLPEICQAFMMSATLTADVKALKKMVLQNAVTLKLEEPELPQMMQLTQYHIKCEDEEKFVLTYALLKLKLILGKSIVFVNSVDRCYRLKLFLEQFGINCCVLNSELPVSSRCHIVSQFNEGVYNIIIASDDKLCEEMKEKKKKVKRIKRDKEYGISRGIDFQFVSNVINFDFPPNVDAYIHRVGRTARGDNKGTAVSFISIKEMPLMAEVEKYFRENQGEDVQTIFKPYNFKMEEIEGFRYRARDALRAVTRIAIREARLKEIKKEILNSQKLKCYFEDNPRDLQLLRHDKALHIVKHQEHLKHVPDYIVPPTLQNIVKHEERNKRRKEKQKNNPEQKSVSKSAKRFKKRQKDPLKSFKC